MCSSRRDSNVGKIGTMIVSTDLLRCSKNPCATMTNAEIAAAFDKVADLLEFQGANAFRVRAYRNAANAIRMLPEQLSRIAADPNRKLTDIAGIGKDLANSILELIATRRLPLLDELQAEIPHSAMAMLTNSGTWTPRKQPHFSRT